MDVVGKTFRAGEELVIRDNTRYVRCTFEGVTFVYESGRFLVSECVIKPNCTVRFGMAAMETLGFLYTMQGAGFVLDDFFKAFRQFEH